MKRKNMNNDTPRTNAQEFDSKLCHPDTAVDAEFARELEREITRLRKALRKSREARREMQDYIDSCA